MPLSSRVAEMIDGIIHREGGYVNHPQDPGGETKYGISKRAYPELDIKNLSIERARDIYARDYYFRFSLDRLDNSTTAEWVLDWVVNSGTGAIRSIQRELGLEADGVVGNETVKALNGLKDPKEVLRWRLKFFCKLAKHPFLVGWINRLIELGL